MNRPAKTADPELTALIRRCDRTTSRLCEQSAELRERHEEAEQRTQRASSTWRRASVEVEPCE